MDANGSYDIPAIIYSSNQVMHRIRRFSVSLSKGQLDSLKKKQCKAIKLAFGYMRTTSESIMLAEAKITQITFRLK
jgi:hypothetical protein